MSRETWGASILDMARLATWVESLRGRERDACDWWMDNRPDVLLQEFLRRGTQPVWRHPWDEADDTQRTTVPACLKALELLGSGPEEE